MALQRYLHYRKGDLRYDSQADCVTGWFRSGLCVLLVILVPKVRTGNTVCSSLHISPNRRSCIWPSRWSDHRPYGRCKRSCRLALALCMSNHWRLVQRKILTRNRYSKVLHQLLLQSPSSSSCPTILQANLASSTRKRASSHATDFRLTGLALRKAVVSSISHIGLLSR